MSATWTPGDRFRLAAIGDRYDGVTGKIRGLFTDGHVGGQQFAHVTHDDGKITAWPTTRLEKPTDPSDGAVTPSSPAPSDAPSLVELDRAEAAAEARSNHAVTIDYNTGAPFPVLTFRCTAPAGELCHAYYECSCEEWGQEGVIHGKPWHVDHDDVNHFGYWRNDECRLQDWFENSDEAVVGSVSVPVTAKYTGGWYEFDITAVQS